MKTLVMGNMPYWKNASLKGPAFAVIELNAADLFDLGCIAEPEKRGTNLTAGEHDR